MPTTTGYEFGDVVLVPFPFTDQSTTKQRPAVVISSAAYQRERHDLIILAITSQVRAAATVGEVSVKDWKQAGLIKPSVMKPVIATIERRLVRKRMGTLSTDDQQTLRAALTEIIG
jgi:mRNA interferase MazF